MEVKANIISFGDYDSNFVYDGRIDIVDYQYGEYKKDKKGGTVFIAYGNAVYLKKVLVNIDDGSEYLVLHFVDSSNNLKEVIFPREKMNSKDVFLLRKFGVQVRQSTTEALIISIENQEHSKDVVREKVHSILGFKNFEGRIIYKHFDCIGLDSTYIGRIDVKPTGSEELWNECMAKYAIGHKPFEVVLSVGACSPIIDFLNLFGNYDNLLCGLVNDSSSGKTVCSMAACSMGANPDFVNGTLMRGHDTSNSILANITSGVPYCVDEISMTQKNYTEMVYALAQGREKRRQTDEKGTDPNVFHTSILATSETSILGSCDKKMGLEIRLMELKFMKFMPTAEVADKVRDTVTSNYGFCIPKIANMLINDGKDTVLDKLERYTKKVVNRIIERGKHNKYLYRLSNRYGLILLGAEYLEKVLNQEINKDDMLDFLIDNCELLGRETCIGRKGLNAICDYMESHSSLFTNNEVNEESWGYVADVKPVIIKGGKVASRAIYISKLRCHQILIEAGFLDPKIVLNSMKEERLLKADKDRYVSRFMLNGMKVSGYIILLSDDNESVDETDNNTTSDKNGITKPNIYTKTNRSRPLPLSAFRKTPNTTVEKTWLDNDGDDDVEDDDEIIDD